MFRRLYLFVRYGRRFRSTYTKRHALFSSQYGSALENRITDLEAQLESASKRYVVALQMKDAAELACETLRDENAQLRFDLKLFTDVTRFPQSEPTGKVAK